MSTDGLNQPPLAELLSTGRCPRCQGRETVRSDRTWWGGHLGPQLLNHTVCRSCGYWFNWKTGEPNGVLVVLFLVAAAFFALILAFVLFGRLLHR